MLPTVTAIIRMIWNTAADEDDEQLLQFTNARPQDQKRNEGGGRQIARKGDERFEEGFDRLVGAHQHAERNGDDRGQHEAADHAPDRHADVEQEAVLGQKLKTLVHHGQRVGEKGFRDIAAEGGPGPHRDEQDEERKAVGHALPRGHGFKRTYHGMFSSKRSAGRGRSRFLRLAEAGPIRRGQVPT